MDDTFEKLQTSLAKTFEAQIAEVAQRARDLGHKEGYAKALSDMNSFLGNVAAKIDLNKVPGAVELAANLKTKVRSNGHSKPTKRHKRGKNRVWVLKALKGADGPIGATEIQRQITTTDGVTVAYSSIRNALAQLVKHGQAFEAGNGQFTGGRQMTLPVETERAS